ncbi:MAG TPA: hypothetical protein PKE04_15160, partial [Clostridia bacterium]|nr:hypothetical protein [Clostridia bacterium]
FAIRPDSVGIRLPLTYEAAKKVISQRDALPPSIDEAIGRFGCCGCGRCSAQANIEIFEGVRLCRLQATSFITEESRLIGIELTTREEAVAIAGIVRAAVGF